ncbi:hypothetical protein KY363_08030, partial [Candidatus Woesearchaeota archaeon]|nr:hypothetical protein [Candidatus Woesearchaeota archaeon]
MAEQLPGHRNRKIEDVIVIVFLMALALLTASQIDNWSGNSVTGMATTTLGTNTSLTIFSTADYVNVSQGELVTFTANYTNITGAAIDNATDAGLCIIRFSDTTSAINMSFNTSGDGTYSYARTFPAPATYLWNVTCNSTFYETLIAADTAVINRTFCGKSVA